MTSDSSVSIQSRSAVKHELITYSASGGNSKVWAGEAFYYPDEDFFQVQLAVFPFPYFVTRNKGSSCHYTVWAQRVRNSEPAKFRRPVGRGTVTKAEGNQQLTNFIQIDIPLLGLSQAPLLCLFPAH